MDVRIMTRIEELSQHASMVIDTCEELIKLLNLENESLLRKLLVHKIEHLENKQDMINELGMNIDLSIESCIEEADVSDAERDYILNNREYSKALKELVIEDKERINNAADNKNDNSI